MSQRSVELVIGKLVTDEEARSAYRDDPRKAVGDLAPPGDGLTAVELEALASVRPDLLDSFADALDPRLQRVRLPFASTAGDRP